jgi:phosphoserine phosphatase
MKHKIEPILMEESQNTVNRHQENDDTIWVITATKNFVAAPVVNAHGVEN